MAEMSSSISKIQKVMVAIDGSEFSSYALKWTLQNLRDSLLNSELIIFTVQPISEYAYIQASSFGVTSPEFMRAIIENQKKTAMALLEVANETCKAYGVTVEILTEVGDPKELICEMVEKQKVELLVLGSHGRGALKRAFLGSVSNYCVNNAKCPVIVVRKTS